MSYRENFVELMTEVKNIKIATDILQYMQRVRNNTEPSFTRRLVFELLQNTIDCAFDDQPVEIDVRYDQQQFVYSHNSKPFRSKDIMSLINQVTSKADDDDTVGKFGTGFATTMQLSPVVSISSILHDENNDYKVFTVDLDRSPEDIAGISSNITAAIMSLMDIDQTASIDFVKSNLNTSFTYKLSDQHARDVAKESVDTFEMCLPFTMCLNPALAKVTINGKIITAEHDEMLSYRKTIVSIGNNRRYFLTQLNDQGNLVIEFDENKCVLPIAPDVPRLFIRYPLIGSHTFPFPVILNSTQFMPNEPRSNISLSDGNNATESKTNKILILEFIAKYKLLIRYLIEEGYKSLENAVELPDYYGSDYHSKEFIKSSIKHNIYDIISNASIVTCEGDSTTTLSSDILYIPYGDNGVQEKVEDLLLLDNNILVPTKGNRWHAILRNYSDLKVKYVSTVQLLERRYKFNIDNVTYCNAVLDMCTESELDDIRLGRYNILVSRCKEFEPISIIRDGSEIPTKIIETLETNNLCENLNLSHILLHPDVKSQNLQIENYNYDLLARCIRNVFNLTNYSTNIEEKLDLIKDLVTFLTPTIHKLLQIEQVEIEKFFDDSELAAMQNWLLRYNVYIFEAQNVATEEDVPFLNFLYSLLDAVGCPVSILDYKIFPTLNGKLHKLTDVCFSSITYADLFEISEKLDIPRYDDLLTMDGIQTNSHAIRFTDEDLMKPIDKFYMEVFFQAGKDINSCTDKQRATSLELYNFFEHYPDAIMLSQVFRDDKARLRLLDLNVVKVLNDKANAYDKICTILGQDPDSLLEKISELDSVESMLNELIPPELRPKQSHKDISTLDVEAPFEDWPEEWQEEYHKFMNDKDRTNLRHKLTDIIGRVGEEGAYKHLIETYGKDYVEKMPVGNEGYDFIVYDNSHEIRYYVEVKTHTPSSAVNNTLRLSKAQYNQYTHSRGKFCVLSMLADIKHSLEDVSVQLDLTPFDDASVEMMLRSIWYHCGG